MGENLSQEAVPEVRGERAQGWAALLVTAFCGGLLAAGLSSNQLATERQPLAGAAEIPPVVEFRYRTTPRTVIRLEVREPGPGESLVAKPAGSGFLVEFAETLFLVTARHLVEPVAELWSRIAYRQGAGGEVKVAELRVPRRTWVLHPSDRRRLYLRGRGRTVVEPVDVAVAKLPWPEGVLLEPLRYCPRSCRAGSHQFAAGDPEPPAEVLMVGYPADLGFELREPRPMVRFGVVAMATTEPALKYLGSTSYANARALALDLRSFAGNSGSPVFRAAGFEEAPILIGLISAGDAELDYAIAEPVSRVVEALEWAARSEVSTQGAWVLAAD